MDSCAWPRAEAGPMAVGCVSATGWAGTPEPPGYSGRSASKAQGPGSKVKKRPKSLRTPPKTVKNCQKKEKIAKNSVKSPKIAQNHGKTAGSLLRPQLRSDERGRAHSWGAAGRANRNIRLFLGCTDRNFPDAPKMAENRPKMASNRDFWHVGALK